RAAVVAICRPRRAIFVVGLMAPGRPTLARAAREQLEVRTGTARLDDRVLLVRLARMLTLARGQEVHLAAAGRQRAPMLALHADQDERGHYTKIEADPAPVAAAVLAHLVPHEVGLVGEAPSFHYREAIRQQRIGTPEIEVGRRRRHLRHRQ